MKSVFYVAILDDESVLVEYRHPDFSSLDTSFLLKVRSLHEKEFVITIEIEPSYFIFSERIEDIMIVHLYKMSKEIYTSEFHKTLKGLWVKEFGVKVNNRKRIQYIAFENTLEELVESTNNKIPLDTNNKKKLKYISGSGSKPSKPKRPLPQLPSRQFGQRKKKKNFFNRFESIAPIPSNKQFSNSSPHSFSNFESHVPMKTDDQFQIRIISSNIIRIDRIDPKVIEFPSFIGIHRKKEGYQIFLRSSTSTNDRKIGMKEVKKISIVTSTNKNNTNVVRIEWDDALSLVGEYNESRNRINVSFKRKLDMFYFKKVVDTYLSITRTSTTNNSKPSENDDDDDDISKKKNKKKKNKKQKKTKCVFKNRVIQNEFPITWSSEDTIKWLENFVFIKKDVKQKESITTSSFEYVTLKEYDKKIFDSLSKFLESQQQQQQQGSNFFTIHREMHKFRALQEEYENESLGAVFSDPKVWKSLESEIIPYLVLRNNSPFLYTKTNVKKSLYLYEDLYQPRLDMKFNESKYVVYNKIIMRQQQTDATSNNCNTIDPSLLENELRKFWDPELCLDDLLSILLFKKGLITVQNELIKKWNTHLTKLSLENLGNDDNQQDSFEDWYRNVLEPFNKKHTIEMQYVFLECHLEMVRRRETKRTNNNTVNSRSLRSSILCSDYKLHFKNSERRWLSMRMYIREELRKRVESLGFHEFKVKLVYSVPKGRDPKDELQNSSKFFLPMIEKVFRIPGCKYGLCHSYVIIGDLALHWLSDSLVHTKFLDYSDDYYEVFCCDARCAMIVRADTVLPVLTKIAGHCVRANLGWTYSQVGLGRKRDLKKNCQEFSSEILKALDFTPFYSVVQQYQEMFRTITTTQSSTQQQQQQSKNNNENNNNNNNIIMGCENVQFMIFKRDMFDEQKLSKILKKLQEEYKKEAIESLMNRIREELELTSQNDMKVIRREAEKRIKKSKLPFTSQKVDFRSMAKKFVHKMGQFYMKKRKQKKLNKTAVIESNGSATTSTTVPLMKKKKKFVIVFFRSHQHIDRLLLELEKRIPNFRNVFPGEYMLLKSFDRSFWIRYKKLEEKYGRESLMEFAMERRKRRNSMTSEVSFFDSVDDQIDFELSCPFHIISGASNQCPFNSGGTAVSPTKIEQSRHISNSIKQQQQQEEEVEGEGEEGEEEEEEENDDDDDEQQQKQQQQKEKKEESFRKKMKSKLLIQPQNLHVQSFNLFNSRTERLEIETFQIRITFSTYKNLIDGNNNYDSRIILEKGAQEYRLFLMFAAHEKSEDDEEEEEEDKKRRRVRMRRRRGGRRAEIPLDMKKNGVLARINLQNLSKFNSSSSNKKKKKKKKKKKRGDDDSITLLVDQNHTVHVSFKYTSEQEYFQKLFVEYVSIITLVSSEELINDDNKNVEIIRDEHPDSILEDSRIKSSWKGKKKKKGNKTTKKSMKINEEKKKSIFSGFRSKYILSNTATTSASRRRSNYQQHHKQNYSIPEELARKHPLEWEIHHIFFWLDHCIFVGMKVEESKLTVFSSTRYSQFLPLKTYNKVCYKEIKKYFLNHQEEEDDDEENDDDMINCCNVYYHNSIFKLHEELFYFLNDRESCGLSETLKRELDNHEEIVFAFCREIEIYTEFNIEYFIDDEFVIDEDLIHEEKPEYQKVYQIIINSSASSSHSNDDDVVVENGGSRIRMFCYSKHLMLKKIWGSGGGGGEGKKEKKGYLPDLLEGSERYLWDFKCCRDEMLCYLLFEKGVNDHVDDLEKQLEDMKKNQSSVVKTFTDWVEMILKPFNQKHHIEFEKVHYKTHLIVSRVNLKKKQQQKMKYITYQKVLKKYRTKFYHSQERARTIRKHLLDTLASKFKSNYSPDKNPSFSLDQLSVKLCLSVPKEKDPKDYLGFVGSLVPYIDKIRTIPGCPFGLAHVYPLIGNLALHWGNEERVIFKDLDYDTYNFNEIFAGDCRCPVFISYDSLLPILNKIAKYVVKMNLFGKYKQSSINAGLKITSSPFDINCQIFSENVLNLLHRTDFFPLVGQYLELFRLITTQYTVNVNTDAEKSGKKNKKNDVEELEEEGEMSTAIGCETLRFMLLENEIYEKIKEDLDDCEKMAREESKEYLTQLITKEHGKPLKKSKIRKEVKKRMKRMIFPFHSRKLDLRNWFGKAIQIISLKKLLVRSGKDDLIFQVFFSCHADVDKLFHLIDKEFDDFRTRFPGTHMLLKSFDRSYSIKFKKFGSDVDQQSKEFLECLPHKDGCGYSDTCFD